jgi:carboxymethylenebutenolidase
VAVPRIVPSTGEIESPRGALRVAEIRLGGVPRGAAIVLCDAGALDRDAADAMNGLAEHGYESIAADLTRTGPVTDDDALRDVGLVLDHLGERGWSAEQIGLVGYGFGGGIALLAAAEFGLGAAVSVAPVGAPEPLPVRTPWLGIFGDGGPWSLGETLASRSPVYTELVSYPGVTGEFYRGSSEAPAHAASFDSWQRTVEWLNLRVVPRLTPLAEAWRMRQEKG